MRFRLYPSAAQEALRLEQYGHARRGSNRRHKVRTLIGQRVEKVKAVYTSQTCNACQHIAAESRKSQATFVCVACGHRANADVFATRNIAAGHAVTARGDLGDLALSVKREPQHARTSQGRTAVGILAIHGREDVNATPQSVGER